MMKKLLSRLLPTASLPPGTRKRHRAHPRAVFPLADYATRAESLADRLVYAMKVDPTTVITKDNAFTRTYRYRGRDLAAASLGVRNGLADRLNLMFRDYPDGWMFHFDLVRQTTDYYPESEFPDTASWLVDQERRERFASGQNSTSELYVTLTYLRPLPAKASRRQMLYADVATGEDRISDTAAWARFSEGCRRFESGFGQDFEMEPLGLETMNVPNDGGVVVDHQLRHLRRCLTGVDAPVRAIPPGYDVSEYISPGTLVNDDVLRVGDTLFWPITVIEPPEYSTPGFLDILDLTPGTFRVSWRYISRDPDKMINDIKKERNRNQQKEQGAADHVTHNANGLVDPEAQRMVRDGEDAYAQARAKSTHFGWFSLSIVVHERIRPTESVEEARTRLRAQRDRIGAALEARAFIISDDDGNQLEVFEGTLPGNGRSNVVKYMLSARNLANFIPTTNVWQGEPFAPDEEYYPKGTPPLAVFATNGRTPFYFNFHVPRRGGHTLVIGDTGAGKSSLIGFLVNQHRRYNSLAGGAQQIIIDRDYSHFVQCVAVGGTHIVVGPETNIGFAPFRHIDEPNEFAWAEVFVACLLREQGIDPTPLGEKIYMALYQLQQQPPENRTLTDLTLTTYISDEMRAALKRYTVAGSAGRLFDASTDEIGDNSFTVFEVSPLIGDSTLHRPGMLMLLHSIERKCSKKLPTLLASEEFWALLDDELSAKTFRGFLKTMRKRGAAVIPITQSLEDVEHAEFKDSVLGSCVTKILLPNEYANSEDNARRYKDLGLEPWERDALVDVAVRRVNAALIVKPGGRRMIETSLDPVTRATVATTATKAIDTAREFMEQFGADWYPEWINYNVGKIDANEGEHWRRHAYYGPPRSEPQQSVVPAPRHETPHHSDYLAEQETNSNAAVA